MKLTFVITRPCKMPNQLRRKPKQKEDLLEREVGHITEEFEAPVASELIFKKLWHIRRFKRTIQKRDCVDSPVFKCSVNGMSTFWNISLRFWKGSFLIAL